jgi:hypothetical protein
MRSRAIRTKSSSAGRSNALSWRFNQSKDSGDRTKTKVAYKHNLTAVDGPSKTAIFSVTDQEGKTSEVTKRFEMMHVDRSRRRPVESSCQRGRLDRGRSGNAPACSLSERVLAGRRQLRPHRQDSCGGAPSGSRRGEEHTGGEEGRAPSRDLRRLWFVSPDSRLRQDRARGICL